MTKMPKPTLTKEKDRLTNGCPICISRRRQHECGLRWYHFRVWKKENPIYPKNSPNNRSDEFVHSQILEITTASGRSGLSWADRADAQRIKIENACKMNSLLMRKDLRTHTTKMN